jgi:hypothetical protein
MTFSLKKFPRSFIANGCGFPMGPDYRFAEGEVVWLSYKVGVSEGGRSEGGCFPD